MLNTGMQELWICNNNHTLNLEENRKRKEKEEKNPIIQKQYFFILKN